MLKLIVQIDPAFFEPFGPKNVSDLPEAKLNTNAREDKPQNEAGPYRSYKEEHMTCIGLLRCRGNDTKCPLTNCFRSLVNREQGFSGYDQTDLTGVFTLQDEVKDTLNLARILKSRGAEAIHVVTCAFAHKKEGTTWELGHGFVPNIDHLCAGIAQTTGLPCIKGSAHLPPGYTPEVFYPDPSTS